MKCSSLRVQCLLFGNNNNFINNLLKTYRSNPSSLLNLSRSTNERCIHLNVERNATKTDQQQLEHSQPLQTPDDSAKLCKQAIYENDQIIGVNKPQGLSVFGNASLKKQDARTVQQMLPDLQNHFKCPELQIGISLKSYYSGVLVLCKTAKSKRNIEKALKTASGQKIPYLSFLAVTVGVPQCDHDVQKEIYVTKEYLHNRVLTVLSNQVNNTARKQKRMTTVVYSIKPLVVNSELGAALVNVKVNKDSANVVECLLSQHLSPVLGDDIYSSRAPTLLGVPYAASAQSAPPAPQKLPEKISECLSSSRPETLVHIHRHQVHLGHFQGFRDPKAAQPLTLTAPPPLHFLDNLRCLGLYHKNMFDMQNKRF